jgi:muconolactone delta-isomerase
MLVFLINRTRPDLTPEQYGRLAELAKAFYANVPPGVSLRGEWAATDYSRNFSLLEAPDVATVERMAAPFREFVDVDIVPVHATSGWTAS